MSEPGLDTRRAASPIERFLQSLSSPASVRFVAIALGIFWFGTFVLWRADYRSFNDICIHDPGAVLRTDEIISHGARPGTDFFYYYGLLPVFVSHVVFAAFGRSPSTLLLLILAISCFSYFGLVGAVDALRPTRFGAVLIAIAAGHATWSPTPTYAMETAILVWAIALRIRGHSAWAVALATVALFVKMSMASVILAALVGLVVLDALRARRWAPLLCLFAVPAIFGVGASLCAAWLGIPALLNGFDARAGAAIYKAYNLGFLRGGSGFWSPVGHSVNWYLGSLAGPWCLASVVVLFLAIRSTPKLIRAAMDRADRNERLVSREVYALSGFANLAFVVAFYGPGLSAYYYAWLLVIGIAPAIGCARLIAGRQANAKRPWVPGAAWVSLGVALLLSQTTAMRHFLSFVGERRVMVGGASMKPEEAEELTTTMALGHSVGGGTVSALTRVANLGLADPSIRQGRYWMLLMGMPTTKALLETVHIAESADVILVTKVDYPELVRIPELTDLLENSSRLHDGVRFLLLRRPPRRDVMMPSLGSLPLGRLRI